MFSFMRIARAIKLHDAYLAGVRGLRRRSRGRSWRPLFPIQRHAYAALSPFGEANRANPAEENTPRITTIGGCETLHGWLSAFGG